LDGLTRTSNSACTISPSVCWPVCWRQTGLSVLGWTSLTVSYETETYVKFVLLLLLLLLLLEVEFHYNLAIRLPHDISRESDNSTEIWNNREVVIFKLFKTNLFMKMHLKWQKNQNNIRYYSKN